VGCGETYREMKAAVFWVVTPCSLVEVSLKRRKTLPDCNDPEDSHLYTSRREKLKSHLLGNVHLKDQEEDGRITYSWILER
jgi:hypothetical protein